MPEFNPNSRFKQHAPGVVTEVMANQTQLFYDPTTQAMRVIFNCQNYLPVGGSFVQFGTDTDILHVDLSDKLTDIVAQPTDLDPITGTPLDQVSILGVAILIKRAHDRYHNLRAIQIAADIAAAEAAAAAAEAAAAAAAAAAANPPAIPPPVEPSP